MCSMRLLVFAISLQCAASILNDTLGSCGLGYSNVRPCPHGSSQGKPQTDWLETSASKCVGPCDQYSTLQWTAQRSAVKSAIKSRNGGSLISKNHAIPKTLDELRCWFLPEFSWGMQNPGPAPAWNPQPEAAYLDDAGNSLGGGLPGPDATVACCCQEECTMEMIELRHFIFKPPGCNDPDINYNSDGNQGRVLLTRLADRQQQLTNTRHEACMCGDKSPQKQLPFYYYVVQGPSNDDTAPTQLWWLDSLRIAYNNLFDIWAANPPCSGECLIMGGASDAWVTYGKSTARSIYFQLRAFAAFDPHALPNACGEKGVMLRFGGMKLDGSTASCFGLDDWGQTGAQCPTMTQVENNFNELVTQQDDDAFLHQAGGMTEIRLETEVATVTINSASGVKVTRKSSCSVPQPTLNMDWRCSATGGVSNEDKCLPPKPTPPPPPTPAPPPTPPPPPGSCTVAPPNNGGCCTNCPANHYCPANKGCYATGQAGCTGGYCPAPASSTSIFL